MLFHRFYCKGTVASVDLSATSIRLQCTINGTTNNVGQDINLAKS